MKKGYIKIIVYAGIIAAIALIIKAVRDYTVDCNEEDELCKNKKWFFKNKVIQTETRNPKP